MFTGIVEELGEIVRLDWHGEGAVLAVRGPKVTEDAAPGDSVAVSGVCLTVVEVDGHVFTADVMKETFDRSALGSVAVGEPVNLERAATVATRLGGHIVQGHVDGVGTIAAMTPGDRWTDVRITLPEGLDRYLVEKGSICVDGISLTVVAVDHTSFTVSLIPSTLALTTLGRKAPGALVNLEVDVIAKYVEKLTPGKYTMTEASMTEWSETESTGTGFATVEEAIKEIAAGRPVVVVDDEDRENEGDLIFAAEKATTELLAFMVRHTSGFVCAPLTEADADRLELPPMYYTNQDRRGTAYTVTVDARENVSTGISAAERAYTIRLLADPSTSPGQLARPGHVVPLRAKDGGVLRRPGHTEAAVDLARMAGLRPAAVLCELVNDDGTMKRLPDLRRFADQHGLALITIADLIAYRRAHERQIEQLADTRLPTEYGTFRAIGYRSLTDGSDHVALVYGDLGDGEGVLVRVHSECLTGDVFASLRCDCGPQLHAAMSRISQEGRGVVLYVRGHEGRGIGLMHKLQAYQLQDQGRDTIDANLELGLPADARDYGTGAQILADLGIRSMRLLTNNPAKRAGLEGYGLAVSGREPLPVRPHPENLRYLRTKRDRMGHLLDDLDEVAEGHA